MNAGRQEGERLQHTFHVRVLALILFEHQARSDLGIFFGELRAHVAEKGQLAFVIEEQIIPHFALPLPDNRRWRAGGRCRRKSVPAPDPSAADPLSESATGGRCWSRNPRSSLSRR